MPSVLHVLKPNVMSVTTKLMLNTSKVFGALLWAGVLYEYGVLEIIGDYITAVINFNLHYLCYK